MSDHDHDREPDGGGHSGHAHAVAADADRRWLTTALALIAAFMCAEVVIGMPTPRH